MNNSIHRDSYFSWFFFIPILCIIVSLDSRAQVLTPDIDFYQSTLNDTTSIALYTSIGNSNQRFTVLDPIAKISFNSGYSRSYNDGAVWKGKGLTLETHFGIKGAKGLFSYTIQPTVFVVQNQDLVLATNNNTTINEYNYQFPIGGGIDYTQQYGQGSYTEFNLGQSEVKFQYKKIVTSISSQNLRFGPAVFNPIIMSNQAAGIPHLRLGLSPTQVNIKKKKILKVEANLIYGLLPESNYYDNIENNNTRYFNGLFIGLSPSIIPNLKLGFNRAMYKDSQFFEPIDIVSPIKIFDSGTRGDSINTNDTFDQLASFTIDWAFPKVGFRAFAEFAKNDFTGGIRWTLLEPEHSRAYTLGFEKIIPFRNDKFLNIVYEHTNLSRNHTYLWRPEPPFYTHGVNRQGYTNNGQIIGAGIGPGSNSDQLNILWKTSNYAFGVKLQRIEFDKDYFVVNIQELDRHNVEYTFGLFHRLVLEKIELTSKIDFSNNLNRYYTLDSDQANLHIAIAVRYRL